MNHILGELVIKRIGRKALVVAGVFLLAAAGTLFAFLPSMNDKWFLATTFLARFVQGIPSAYIQVGGRITYKD